MNTWELLLYLYLIIGIVLGFVGPLSRKLWVERMMMALREDVPPIKVHLFIFILRVGIAIFYPIFLFSN